MNQLHFVCRNYFDIADRQQDKNTPEPGQVKKLKDDLDAYLTEKMEDLEDQGLYRPEDALFDSGVSDYEYRQMRVLMSDKMIRFLAAVDNNNIREWNKNHELQMYYINQISQTISQTLINILLICAPKTELIKQSEAVRRELENYNL